MRHRHDPTPTHTITLVRGDDPDRCPILGDLVVQREREQAAERDTVTIYEIVWRGDPEAIGGESARNRARMTVHAVRRDDLAEDDLGDLPGAHPGSGLVCPWTDWSPEWVRPYLPLTGNPAVRDALPLALDPIEREAAVAYEMELAEEAWI